MFATCLFCNSALGRNQAIEHFPVGRRLAYDAAKGRLWVVCPGCERWNLSPLEERWEAIDEAERAYRSTRKRVATDNVGLARLSEGLELVRIGSPLRPEFAAWRYGDQFGRRRRKHLAYTALGVGAVGGMIWAGPVAGLIVGGGGSGLLNLISLGNLAIHRWVPRATVRASNGALLRLSQQDIFEMSISSFQSNGQWTLDLSHHEWAKPGAVLRAMGVRRIPSYRREVAVLENEAAVRAMASLLPRLNQRGGSASTVRDAVQLVERCTSESALIAVAAREVGATRKEHSGRKLVAKLPRTVRLALEMSLHEEDERRALEGELAALEQRWRDAESIAAIADSLMLPDDTESRIAALRVPPPADQP